MTSIGTHPAVVHTFLDESGETKTIRIPIDEITAVSLPGLLTAMTNLETAYDAVLLGTRSANKFESNTVVSNTPPGDKTAQVETEMLVRLRGATTDQPWSFRLTTVDYAAFNYAAPPAGDQVIISGAGATQATLDLVAAIEAIAATPWSNSENSVVVGMSIV